jgi:2C-methyl-D-erythritol 2,4-cyclodiphosphate synthase
MGIKENQISVKAKTADFLGSIGEGSGWASQAIVTIYKK